MANALSERSQIMRKVKTRTGTLKFYERSKSLPVEVEEKWDTYGVVVEDSDGREHHFGRGDVVGRPFMYVATYDSDGTRAYVYFADDVEDPIRAGHVVREAQFGPRLSPTVLAALSGLAEFCKGKGFAGPTEKKVAVETLQALSHHGHEPFDAEEVYVFAATNGWTVKAAKKLAEFAKGVQNGRRFLASPYGLVRVDPARARLMLERWRKSAASSNDEA